MQGNEGRETRDERNPLEVLLDADIEREWKWNKNFIDRHAKDMGARGRPRRFIRMNVERFALVYFFDDRVKAMAKKAESIRQSALFKSLLRPFPAEGLPAIGGGVILGRGGRSQKKESAA